MRCEKCFGRGYRTRRWRWPSFRALIPYGFEVVPCEPCRSTGSVMPKTYTWADVLKVADRHIEDDDNLIYDVAAERGQMVDNIKHMRWFRHAVALEVIATSSKYADVEPPREISERDHG